ncbi:asparaginyl-tRNA synthetase [Mycoemilia scoparia]|uniref:Asparagine--tRNA ligase, mitochondrial n=1 Tax=Mycoemilia scoparia TaxID=417184 RepID=A0A9W7ZZU6_9FUNG|nr:asparaginyl-tRNA synthetase [Mycoemilia scoparia]
MDGSILKDPSNVGLSTTVHGWVKSVRLHKQIAFVEVADGSVSKGIQVVIETPELAQDLSTGCSIKIVGKVVKSMGKKQDVEIHAESVDCIGAANPKEYPLQKKRHSLEYLREIGHLRLRSNIIGSVLRLRDFAERGFSRFFADNEFLRVHTPILTSNDCEGGGETFNATTEKATLEEAENSFFGRKVNLTVSGQLHAEVAASAFPRVYTFGPVFRAEPSLTGRHLAEFWMLEAECAFITSLSQLMDVIEESIKSTTRYIQDMADADLALFSKWVYPELEKRLSSITTQKAYPRITYTEAIEILQKATPREPFEFAPKWGSGLQSEHEKYLSSEHFESPVFVTDYPIEVKPFYMLANPDGRTVACMDLLVPGPCELAGGSLREHSHDKLLARITDLGMEAESLDWYLDLRKFGTTPHGGFGIGFDRYIQMLTGLESIRDIIPFPRYYGRCQY